MFNDNYLVVVLVFVFGLPQRALWSDMFTGRLKTEIPDALVGAFNHLLQQKPPKPVYSMV